MNHEPTTPLDQDATRRLRLQIYAMLGTIAIALVVGRVLATDRMISWNDISRWATIRALAEEGTFVIGERVEFADGTYFDRGLVFDRGPIWHTGDKVLHPYPVQQNPHAQDREVKAIKQFYSSKPPLMPTVMAGAYWLLHRGFGLRFDTEMTDFLKDTFGLEYRVDRSLILRIMLLLCNVVPFAFYLVLMALMIERWGRTDFGRLTAFSICCFATFLSTFQITLNNHTIAACFLVFGLHPLMRQATLGIHTRSAMAWSGWWFGWMVCNELPSLAFAGLVGLYLMRRQARSTLAIFLPCFLLPVAGLAITNYLAIGQWQPAYAQFGTVWYNYQDSPWLPDNRSNIDKGSDSVPVYIFHQLVGHHGIFSLTPVFLLSLVGLRWSWLPDRLTSQPCRILCRATLLVFVIVFCFYLTKTESYNYGGWTSGLRWFFWLIPLFVLAMLPVLDSLSQKRGGILIVLLLLAPSVISVSYPWSNPWRHPWLYIWMEHMGWIKY